MSSVIDPRLEQVRTPRRRVLNDFAQSVAAGLGARRKALSPRFFYDKLGSRLFERICRLPEYYLTRTETEILRRHATGIIATCGATPALVELGSGSSEKTRLLLDALDRLQPRQLSYTAIDISQSALKESARMLLDRYPDLNMTAIAAEYRDGLRLLAGRASGPRLILFLGSNIGNMEAQEAIDFLRHLRHSMSGDDRFLISTDLIKDRQVLKSAYDDAAGVTAAFNRNILRRINRELGGDFDLTRFHHKAVFHEGLSRIEMHLVSACAQCVSIAALETTYHFSAGESIHTESSHKYSQDQIERLAQGSGFRLGRQWCDEDRRFAVNLFVPV